jgi:uncharacterized membrane protein
VKKKEENSRYPDVLDRKISFLDLQELRYQGFLSEKACKEAINFLKTHTLWRIWIDRMSFFLGAALFLAGVIFFFAYNWVQMSSFQKFAVLETAMFLALLGAWKKGFENLSGKFFLLVASIFLGVFLAVYGQVYQTGADAYDFFRGWTLLILIWVLISEFSILWGLCLILVNLTWFFYWNQILIFDHSMPMEGLWFVLAGINFLVLLFHESSSYFSASYMEALWTRWLLLVAVLVFLTIPTLISIVDGFHGNTVGVLMFVFFAVLLFTAYKYYRFYSYDLFSLTCCFVAFLLIFLTFVGDWMFKNTYDESLFFCFGLIILFTVTLAVLGLKKISRLHD